MKASPPPDQWELASSKGEYMRHRVYWDGHEQLRLGESLFDVYYSCENTTGRGWRSAENAHEHHELLYALEGESHYCIGGQPHVLKAGHFCFIPRHTPHHAWLSPGAERTRVFVVVLDFALTNDPDVFVEHPDSLPVAAPLYQYFFLEHNRLLACPERLRPHLELLAQRLADDASASEPDYDLIVQTSLMELLLYASQAARGAKRACAPPGRNAARSRQVLRLEKSRQFIQARFAEAFSMKEAARQAHMSRYHFLRQFKQVFGVTPTQYRINLRIQEAKRLLTLTDMPVSAVAYRVGYQNPEHFSRYFSRRVGLSPRRYARASSKQNDT